MDLARSENSMLCAPVLPRPEPPRFDPAREAWIFSRYADVAAALREPGLDPAGARTQGAPPAVDHASHAAFRESAKAEFSAGKAERWLAAAAPESERICQGLARNQEVDLLGDFAEPWALALALTVTGAGPLRAGRLRNLARDVFLAAAEPDDDALQAAAARATVELAAGLGGPLGVQAFVALSQTLPCFLAGAWLALLEHPGETERLRAQPDLVPDAVEELLRYATPARAQFRRAVCDLNINGTRVEAGRRVILMLAAANRDPDMFPGPQRLDWRRGPVNHLAFGGGGHSCIGAALIRAAAAAAMRAYLDYFGGAELCGPIAWRGGFAIRWPSPLLVRRPAG